MELYRKTFKEIDECNSLVMVAKATKQFMSNSKKLSHVHISPVSVESCEGYNMETSHSGSRCIRLVFSKSYLSTQTKAMHAEIKLLAAERLTQSIGNPESEESAAFKSALEFLASL